MRMYVEACISNKITVYSGYFAMHNNYTLIATSPEVGNWRQI